MREVEEGGADGSRGEVEKCGKGGRARWGGMRGVGMKR